MIDPLEYLRDAHGRGLLVPFVGAGLGKGAASLPSWPELVELGIEYCEASLGIDDSDPRMQRIRFLVDSSSYPEAFETLAETLGVSGSDLTCLDMEAFMAGQFANPEVADRALLDALSFLDVSQIVTTNYDTLLEDWGIGGANSVTWEDSARVRDIFRTGDGVVHLHGIWSRPESIIWTQSSYDRIAADAPSSQIARVIFHGSILLFMCTSLDGTHDPHLAALLAEFEKLSDRRRGEASPHIMLVKGPIDGMSRARLNRQGIEPVSFGEEFSDLPRFIRSIGERPESRINADRFSDLVTAVFGAESLDDALRSIGSWIEADIFYGRRVRVSFSEKISAGSGHELRRRAVVPPNSSGNPHNYPLSMSAWALVEGRPIEWPGDRLCAVDFAWLRRTNKYDTVKNLISSPELNNSIELARYVDLDNIRRVFDDESMKYGDFFQDWASDQRTPPYTQFISVPVPWLGVVGTRETPVEFGVFNVDSRERAPLMNSYTRAQLKLAASVAASVYSLFEK